MSIPYRSELCHALDETRMTVNRTTVGVSSPLENEHQSKKDDLIEEEPCDEVCDVSHSCKVIGTCQWNDGTSPGACSARISCKTIPAHFRDVHNIKGIGWITKLDCWWRGCNKQVSRKNFARHLRETHLGHPRSKKDPS